MMRKRNMPAFDLDRLSGFRMAGSGFVMTRDGPQPISRSDRRAEAHNREEIRLAFGEALQERDGEMVANVQACLDKRDKRIGELEAKLKESESHQRDVDHEVVNVREMLKRMGLPRAGGGFNVSLGHQIATNEATKGMLASGARSAKMAITTVGTGSPDGLAVTHPDIRPEITPLARKPLTIRSLLPAVQTTENSIRFVRQVTRDNAAAPVPETQQKPESKYSWEPVDAPVRTLAHWVPVSRQAMDDAASFAAELDRELAYGLDLLEDAQLLSGSGVGENLAGLTIAATAFDTGRVEAGDQQLDYLLHAVAQLADEGYTATGIVLSPTDFYKLAKLKTTENQYLVGSPMAAFLRQLWQTPVAISHSMQVDSFLVGAFDVAATIYDRMETEVLISSEHADFFTKNMLAVRAEKRLALAVKRPTALVTGDFGLVT